MGFAIVGLIVFGSTFVGYPSYDPFVTRRKTAYAALGAGISAFAVSVILEALIRHF